MANIDFEKAKLLLDVFHGTLNMPALVELHKAAAAELMGLAAKLLKVDSITGSPVSEDPQYLPDTVGGPRAIPSATFEPDPAPVTALTPDPAQSALPLEEPTNVQRRI